MTGEPVEWVLVLDFARWRPDGTPYPEMLQGIYELDDGPIAVATSGNAVVGTRDPVALGKWYLHANDRRVTSASFKTPEGEDLYRRLLSTPLQRPARFAADAIATAVVEAKKRDAAAAELDDEGEREGDGSDVYIECVVGNRTVLVDARLVAVAVVSPARTAGDAEVELAIEHVPGGFALRARGEGWIAAVMECRPHHTVHPVELRHG